MRSSPDRAAVAPKPAANGAEAEAVAALISLGYSSAEAARAVSQVAGQSQEPDKLIFLALRRARRLTHR